MRIITKLRTGAFAGFIYEARWALLFTFIVYGANITTSDIRGDSIMYTMIAKNIVTMKEYFILHYDGADYMNKPPIFFWINSLMMALFGFTTFSAKIGSVLIAAALSLSIYQLAKKLTGSANIANLSVFVMNTSYIVYRHNYSVRLEGVVTLFMVLAVLSYVYYTDENRQRYMYLFGFFSGLAFMSKGFVGIIHLGGVGIFMLLYGREVFSKRNLPHLILAFMLFLATFGWWYVYVSLHTDFFNHFFNNQVLDRMMNGLFHEEGKSAKYLERPVYQYVIYLSKYYFMYIPFLVYGCWKALKTMTPVYRKGILLVFIIMTFELFLIHFVSTRDKRYLYQFFVFASVFTAVGVSSLIRISYEKMLAGVSVVYALFLIIYPGQTNWDTYGFLETLKSMSSSSGMPVVARVQDFKNHENRAGVMYFLDEYITEEPVSGEYFMIIENEMSDPALRVIRETRRIKIGVKSAPAEMPAQ